jgi:hypothetical protein
LFIAACAYGQDPPARSIPVYVSDFELSATTSKPSSPLEQTPRTAAPAQKPQRRTTGSSASDSTPASVYQDADVPYIQARRLIDFFSTTLLHTLQKSGYAAAPQLGARPSNGVLIRGIFTEYDDMNRVRRAILGSASASPKFALYVGIFNLSHPDQPLYEPAAVQSPDNRYGPIITLNNYIPLAKYELDKKPTQEDVRRICSLMVRDLSSLLDRFIAA